MRSVHIIALLCCFFIATATSPYSEASQAAEAGNSKTKGKAAHKQKLMLSKSQAAQIARRQFGGKILKVKHKTSGGRSGYQVKILNTSGHVKQVWIDAHSGNIF